MGSRRSSKDKGKRRLDKNYDSLLFDSNQHALKFSSIESRHVHKGKYIDLDELSDLELVCKSRHSPNSSNKLTYLP